MVLEWHAAAGSHGFRASNFDAAAADSEAPAAEPHGDSHRRGDRRRGRSSCAATEPMLATGTGTGTSRSGTEAGNRDGPGNPNHPSHIIMMIVTHQ